MKKNSTVKFYENNAEELITRYDSANVEQLHAFFSKYIKKDDAVLDIGFGSGRDLKEILKITSNVFGLDACEIFIQNAEKISGLKGRVAKSVLPEIQIDQFKINISKFDVIVSVAVFMHLNVKEIEQTVKKIKSIILENGICMISYSLHRKNIDERHFEPLYREDIVKIFEKFGFDIIDEFENNDGLSRDIKWVTQVYRIGQIPRLTKVESPSLSRNL